jgi:hypothetical protein
MAFKQIGETTLATGINVEVTIAGCTIFSSTSKSEGYRNVTEIIGHDGETACVVMSGEKSCDITINGYVDAGGSTPKNGDEVAVSGYTIGWIDGVTISETPDGVTTFSATVHGRG